MRNPLDTAASAVVVEVALRLEKELRRIERKIKAAQDPHERLNWQTKHYLWTKIASGDAPQYRRLVELYLCKEHGVSQLEASTIVSDVYEDLHEIVLKIASEVMDKALHRLLV